MIVATLIGRLTRAADVRYDKEGRMYATCRVACDGGRADTVFVGVTAFGRLAQTLGDYGTKGRLVAVYGRLAQSEWRDANGDLRRDLSLVAQGLRYLSRSDVQAPSDDAGPAGASADAEPETWE